MEESDILEKIVKGAGITAFGMFVSKFMSYLYRSLVARYIGPEAYGTISLGIMVASLGVTISVFALNSAIKNYVPKFRERDNYSAIKGIVSSAFKISFLISITVSALIFVSSNFIASEIFNDQSLTSILRIFAFVPPFAVISKHSLDTTVAFKNAKYSVFTKNIFQNIVQLLSALTLIFLGFKIEGAAAGWLIGSISSAILGLYFMEKKIGPVLLREENSEKHTKKILEYSYPLVLSGTIASILGWTDTALIGYFMDSTSVGFYNAALPTALLLMIPYLALSKLVMPSMSEIVEKNGKLGSTLKSVTRWTFMITFPMFILMALFSEQVLHILFGHEYRTASLSLTILSLGYLYSASAGHLDSVIKALDRPKILFYNSTANLGLNIVLNILLIPRFGIAGAAAATMGSSIFANSLLLIQIYKIEKVHPFSWETLKPIAASIPSLIVVYVGLQIFFNTVPIWVLIPGGAVFGFLYLCSLYLIGGIKDEELHKAKELMKEIKTKMSNRTYALPV